MQQLSLFDNLLSLAGVLPSVKAEMRRILGPEGGENRKEFVDKLNAISARSQVPLTGGNVKVISKDTLDKIVSPSDTSHPPSTLFMLAFCQAANDYEPLRVVVRAAGFELMSEEDRRIRDYGRAILEEKAARKRKRLLEERL
jgi:hypothetical protein